MRELCPGKKDVRFIFSCLTSVVVERFIFTSLHFLEGCKEDGVGQSICPSGCAFIHTARVKMVRNKGSCGASHLLAYLWGWKRADVQGCQFWESCRNVGRWQLMELERGWVGEPVCTGPGREGDGDGLQSEQGCFNLECLWPGYRN